jgi:WD40 repeat protein
MGERAVAVSPDGRFIVSGSEDRTVKVWELESGRLLRSLEGHTDDVNAVAVSPDGRFIVSGSGGPHGEGVGARKRAAAALPGRPYG